MLVLEIAVVGTITITSPITSIERLGLLVQLAMLFKLLALLPELLCLVFG